MQRKTKRNKVLSVVLSIALLMGMSPIMSPKAYADEPTKDKVIEAEKEQPKDEEKSVIDGMLLVAPETENKAENDTTVSEKKEEEKSEEKTADEVLEEKVANEVEVDAVAKAGQDVLVDPNFRKEINEDLSTVENPRNPQDPVTKEDMEKVEHISLGHFSEGVVDVTGIKYATNLKFFDIQGDTPKGLEEIQNLTNLEIVRMRIFDSNNIDIGWFSNTNNLKELVIGTSNSNLDLKLLGKKHNLKKLTIESNDNITSLDGLSPENAPMLEELNILSCLNIKDISALGSKFTNLKKLTIIGGKITDLSPLKGYDTLTYLKLNNVIYDKNNSKEYAQTINSLKSLEELDLETCNISDDITWMFDGLTNLRKLNLRNNEISDLSFLDKLPAELTALGLQRNEISDISKLARFKKLKIFEFSENKITDFSVFKDLPELTSETMGLAGEGSNDYKSVETYEYNTKDTAISVNKDTEIRIPNPYKSEKGEVVDFSDRVETLKITYDNKDFDFDFRYDKATNEFVISNVVFKNPTGTSYGTIDIIKLYDMTFKDGRQRHYRLKTRLNIKNVAEKVYIVQYDWGREAPNGEILPTNGNIYKTEQEAEQAVDTKYTKGYTVKGQKDGKNGTWVFSGWTKQEPTTFYIVKFKGNWTFTEDVNNVYNVEYVWATDAPANVKLPVDNKTYNTLEEAKASMDTTLKPGHTVAGQKNGKNGLWNFTGWAEEVVNNTVKFKGSWTFTEDSYNVEYKWGNEHPENVKLPVDDKTYNTFEEAEASMDTTFKPGKTTVKGTKDGKEGVWTFAGWTVTGENTTVVFVGEWTFAENKYLLQYDWGTDAPTGLEVPKNDNVYNTIDDMFASLDKTYHTNYSVRAEKDGKQGQWIFSGWKFSEWTSTDKGEVAKYVGSWKFVNDSYSVVYDWGTQTPEGQKLPENKETYNTLEQVRNNMDKTFTNQTSIEGKKDGKDGVWKFSGWTEKVENYTVKYTGSWTFTEKTITPPAPSPEPTQTPSPAPTPNNNLSPNTNDKGIFVPIILFIISIVVIIGVFYKKKKSDK